MHKPPQYWGVSLADRRRGLQGCSGRGAAASDLSLPFLESCHTTSHLPPPNRLSLLLQSLASILKKPGVRKKPYLVRGHDEVLTAARNITSDSLAPIFLTSAVTGAPQGESCMHAAVPAKLQTAGAVSCWLAPGSKQG
jgi:hypothetical protein